MKDDWISFAQEVAFLQSTDPPNIGMFSIYRTRDSCMQTLFEGVILVPCRKIEAELAHPTFSFVPHDSRRRLVKHAQIHFLGRRLRQLSELTCQGPNLYTDSANKVAATRKKSGDLSDRESEIKLRYDVLADYCRRNRFAAFWVTDSYRYSERLPEEYDVPVGRIDIADGSFCYFHYFGECGQVSRFRTRSVSLLCGKRLLTPALDEPSKT